MRGSYLSAMGIDESCSCATCKERFADEYAFDAHRVGEHDYLWSEERPDGRRCLQLAEFAAAGLVEAAGVWALS